MRDAVTEALEKAAAEIRDRGMKEFARAELRSTPGTDAAALYHRAAIGLGVAEGLEIVVKHLARAGGAA